MFKDLVIPVKKEKKYILFSGKGGVGKSTVSAATAVWLANQGLKTLIISTDLQLSLSDVFSQQINSKPTPINGVKNLTAISIDAAESLDKHRQKTIETLRILEPESFTLKQMEMDKTVECGSAQAAVFEFSEYMNNEEYDVIIFDNAPTGAHLEKLLAQSKYVVSISRQVEKHKQLIMRLGEKETQKQIEALEELMEKDKKAVERLQSDLTSFLMIMTPEALPLAELERNIPVLEKDFKIPVRGIIINNVISEKERISVFWQDRANMQKKYIDKAFDKFKDKKISMSFLLDDEVLGIQKLVSVGNNIYGGN